MPKADRITTEKEGVVLACPECDHAGDIHRRHRSNTHTGDPDDPLACGQCGASFEEPVERPPKKKGAAPKYADLTPEDLGLGE